MRIRFLRAFLWYVSPDIRNAMHMRVYAYPVVAKAYREHQVCRLPPNSRQIKKLLHRPRNAAAMVFKKALAGLPQVLRLGVIKPNWKNQRLDFLGSATRPGFWRRGTGQQSVRKQPPSPRLLCAVTESCSPVFRMDGRLPARATAPTAGTFHFLISFLRTERIVLIVGVLMHLKSAEKFFKPASSTFNHGGI